MDEPEAIQKLERQRHLLLNLQAKSSRDPAFTEWKRDTEIAIEFIFGEDSRHVIEFGRVRWWSPAPPPSYSVAPAKRPPSGFEEGRNEADALLRSMIKEINEYGLESRSGSKKANKLPVPTKPSKKIFVVHGRDGGFRDRVARFLEKLKLDPVILHELPNKGRTIIEKFMDYSDVSFAVVLLTADDRGGLSDTSFESQKKRARQNVILELGFFVGRLGRDHVCALYGTVWKFRRTMKVCCSFLLIRMEHGIPAWLASSRQLESHSIRMIFSNSGLSLANRTAAFPLHV
jgi:hypothetical protein